MCIDCGTKDIVNRKKCNGYPTTLAQGLDGVLWLLFEQDIEHRVRCPINRTETRCEPHMKELPSVSHNLMVRRHLEKLKETKRQEKSCNEPNT